MKTMRVMQIEALREYLIKSIYSDNLWDFYEMAEGVLEVLEECEIKRQEELYEKATCMGVDY